MSPSPSSTRARDILKSLRDRLRARQAAGGWLEKAKEIRIGLHARDQSFLASGVYILPSKLSPDETESVGTNNEFRLRLIVQVRALEGDQSDNEPRTFDLTDIVFGILDDVENNYDLTLSTGEVLHMELNTQTQRSEVDFEVVPLDAAGFAYRAEIQLTVHLEVNP